MKFYTDREQLYLEDCRLPEQQVSSDKRSKGWVLKT